MFDPETALATVLARPHQPVARLSVLASLDGVALASWEGTGAILDAGSVSYDRTRQPRRSADLTLVNHTGSLSPVGHTDLLAPGAWVRVERGALVSGSPRYAPLITGTVMSYGAGMGGRLSMHVEDPMHLCQQPFGDTVTIIAGTPAEEAVRTILEPVLGGSSDWSLDGAGRTTPLRVFLEDEEILGGVVDMMAALGLELFADRFGRPVLRVVPDSSDTDAVTVVRDLVPGPTSVLLDLQRTGDRVPYNRVIVVGQLPEGSTVRSVVEVTDPASPLHRDRIGVRTAPVYRSDQIPDQAACNAVANALLREYALFGDTVSGDAIPDLRLDEDDVVRITEPISGTSDRYRIERIAHPVTAGSMSLDGARVLPLVLTA